MKIIGLLGAAGSGKTATSQYLVEKYGAKLYSFAKPLKEIILRAFDLSPDQVYGTQKMKETVDPRYGVSGRWLMQRIGTEGIRAVLGPDFWWEYCLGQILMDMPELAVIDDFRFANEVDGFLSLNDADYAPMVDIWRIESPDPESEADPEHQSEAEWSSCNYTRLIKPEVRGLVELYDAIDHAAFESGLLPAVEVLK